MAVTTAIIIRKTGISFNMRFAPIHSTRPEDLKAEAIANPPPISIAIAHGISLASSHSNNRSILPSLFLRPLDRLNRTTAAKNATVESLTKLLTPKKDAQLSLKMKPKAYKITITNTFLSAKDILPSAIYSCLIT